MDCGILRDLVPLQSKEEHGAASFDRGGAKERTLPRADAVIMVSPGSGRWVFVCDRALVHGTVALVSFNDKYRLFSGVFWSGPQTQVASPVANANANCRNLFPQL